VKILVVEDDALLLQGLLMALEGEGYVCDGVSTSHDAQAALASGLYSLLILDLGLPDEDGLRLLLRLRRQKKKYPVLILTARDTVGDRITGLDAGADDYLIKPFALEELLARIRALIRRDVNQGDSRLTFGQLALDMTHRQIHLADRLLELTPKEYAILSRLMLKAGQPVHREILYNDIYNWETEPSTNTLEVHIHNLREKIGRSAIRTVRGFGYALIKADTDE
jgi:two-component system response regulator BasR